MHDTAIGVCQDDKPLVVGAGAGRHQVDGGDEETFTEGLWLACVTANNVTRS